MQSESLEASADANSHYGEQKSQLLEGSGFS